MNSQLNTTISLLLNGSSCNLPVDVSLEEALSIWNNTNQNFAVAINEIFIPRHAYADTMIKQDDSIEFLIPMQGG